MKSLLRKLGVIFIGLVIFSFAEVWGADWKLYSRDDEEIRYYDAEGMVRPSENTVKVWLNWEYTDKGVMRMVKELGKKYKNISYTMALGEISCLDKKIQTLSLIRNTKEGYIISTSSHTGTWQYFVPGLLLYEALCSK